MGPNLAEIQQRLLETLRARAQNGEITQHGLARLAGISQPHIHNVLKGARIFSPEFTDLILRGLGLSVLDLCTSAELEEYLNIQRAAPQPMLDLPFLSNAIGPGQPWPNGVNWQDRLSVPGGAIEPGQELVLARLLPDINMQYSELGYNIAVLDVSEIDTYADGVVYVVDRGRDTILRSIRLGREKVYLVADGDADYPARWEATSLPLGPTTPLGSVTVIRARVCGYVSMHIGPQQSHGPAPD